MTYVPTSPIFARARATQAAFRAVLVNRSSPAAIEAGAIYEALTAYSVDPAVFLGQFAAESTYGTSGYARTTKSPGNIVISRPLLPHWTLAFGGRPWKAPNGRTYAKFSTWRDGTRAYVALLRTYRARGWATTIATMASHWLGMPDATHSGYVHNIVTHANLAVPAPEPTPTNNPYPVGSIEYVQWWHDHGYWQVDGKWVLVGDPPPPPPPPVRHPPIPLTPTDVPALVSYTEPQTGEPVVLGPYPALRYGSSGPVFVLVHGGPFAVMGTPNAEGQPEPDHRLAELGWRLAARGARAFAIDYRSSDVSWSVAVADVGAAIASVRKLVGGPVTVVAHSFGGLSASIAVLRDGVAEAYVAVCAISSAAGVAGMVQSIGVPDPIVLAAQRPAIPVTVVRGRGDVYAPADDKEGFIRALHAAGHPGLNVMGPGDHSGTLLTDATLDAILATAKLI